MTTFSITGGPIPDDARVVGFVGDEALSRPFVFDVFVNLEGDGSELDEGLGSDVVLHLRPTDLLSPLGITEPPHDISGILWETELVRAVAGRAVVRLRLVPRLALLENSFHSKTWQKKTIVDVLTEVLESNGLASGSDFEFRVPAPPAEEHVCQFEETDLTFFQRWIERQGWSYFVDHRDGHRLIITEELPAEPLGREVPQYRPRLGEPGYAKQSFGHFSLKARAMPKGITARDHNYSQPNRRVEGGSPLPKGHHGEQVFWGERTFFAGVASAVATARAKGLESQGRRMHARGSVTHLSVGFGFSLAGHPRDDLNTEYLILSVHHQGRESPQTDIEELSWEGASVYTVEVECQPKELPFRTPWQTPWPKVTGFQHATVLGPAGIAAPIDAEGRYEVRFHFDENRAGSTRLRMAKPHGGPNEGMHLPLRSGTEVLCGFLGGNPDCPVVVGAAPNATLPSPVVEQNLSQNILETASGSYWVIEDQSGSEFINLHSVAQNSSLYLGAPRGDGGRAVTSNQAPDVPPVGPGGQVLGPFSMDLRTEGHGQVHAAADVNVRVGGDYQLIAGAHTNITYNTTLDFDAMASVDEDYHADLKVHVEAHTDVDYEATLDSTITGASTEFFRNTVDVTVTLSTTVHLSATLSIVVVGAAWVTKCTPPYELKILGDSTDRHIGNEKFSVSGHELFEIDGSLTETILGGNYSIDAGSFKIDDQQTVLQTVFGGASSKWNDVTSVFNALKLDVVLGVHLELWQSHHEVLASFGLSVTETSLEATGVALEVAAVAHFETTLEEVGNVVGMASRIAAINMQANSAASMMTGGARLAQHLISILA